MVYNRFTIKVILYSLLIALSALALIWSLDQQYLTVAKFTLSIIFILTIINLILYVNRTNTRVTNVLMAIKDLDSVPDDQRGESFKQLKNGIDKIINSIKDVKTEREIEHQYFHYTLQKINTAVISFDSGGKITIFNNAAQQLLDIANPDSINTLLDKHVGLAPLFKVNANLDPTRIETQSRSRILKLLGQSNLIILDGEPIRVVTLIDITNQLNDEEILAYNKLIRVINHEIMNSVSPIKSLLNTLNQLFNKDGNPISPSTITQIDIDNTLLALTAMQKRAEGLMQFVESYRRLTRIPQPMKQLLPVNKLFQSIVILKQPDAKEAGIMISTAINPSNLIIYADESLVNQVLINLVNNAVEALIDGGEIKLLAGMNNSGLHEISVEDNGSGIEPDNLEKVFTPFFTTKNEGSGIGLSLSREIIRLHGGSIDVTSKLNIGTKVIIQLPINSPIH